MYAWSMNTLEPALVKTSHVGSNTANEQLTLTIPQDVDLGYIHVWVRLQEIQSLIGIPFT